MQVFEGHLVLLSAKPPASQLTDQGAGVVPGKSRVSGLCCCAAPLSTSVIRNPSRRLPIEPFLPARATLGRAGFRVYCLGIRV